MDSIIEQAKYNEQTCTAFIQQHETKQKELEYARLNQITLTSKEFRSNNALTLDELCNLGSTITREFRTAITFKNYEEFDERENIPAALVPRNEHNYFDEFDEKLYISNQKHREYKMNKDTKKLQKEFYSGDPSDNCRKLYFMCLEQIQKYDIEIYSVQKNVHHFTNRTKSSYDGDSPIFVFCCQKVNFKFRVEFFENDSYFPGILQVSNIVELISDIEISGNCDLFGHSNPYIDLKNFIDLINSNTWEEFVNKKYGHLLGLPELLKKYGFDVSDSDTHDAITINKNKLDFVIEVTYGNNSLSIIPKEEAYDGLEYILYICRSLDSIPYCERDYIDPTVKTFYKRLEESAYKFRYRSSDDIEQLVICINAYIDHKNGQYGYVENGKFKNELTASKYIYKNFPNLKHKRIIYSTSNNFDGPDFDLWIFYTPHTDELKPLYQHRLSNLVYMRDSYGIHFVYNKKIDKEQCKVTIQGIYYDLSRMASDFYENQSKDFDSRPYICYTNKFNYSGSYSECLEIIYGFLKIWRQ